jgi:hypothetical protein
MTQFNLNDDDVVTMEPSKSIVGIQTFLVKQFKEGLSRVLQHGALGIWLAEGVRCQVLRPTGGGWQKGKVRLSLEFIPDEPSEIGEDSTPKSDDLVLSPNSEQLDQPTQ